MSGGRFRKLVLLGLVGAVVAAVVRALRGGPAPAFESHPSASRHEPDPGAARAAVAAVLVPVADVAADEPSAQVPAPTTEPTPPTEPTPTAGSLHVEAIAADGTAFTVLDEASGADADEAPAPAPAATGGDPAARWVDPVDGACPSTHPIKGKLKSGIFHSPGGLAYERTNPDRCYRTAADAEADGLRAAKR